MRYHDHNLCGYEVRDFGGTIVLHLKLRSADGSVTPSVIRFEAVVFYHFIHTAPAIILDIYEMALQDFVGRYQRELAEWDRQQRVALWTRDSGSYQAELQRLGVKAWMIESAIGFTGCVVAKLAHQVE